MRYMLENPGQMVATMKITMTVAEWEELRDELSHKWPASKLSESITRLLTDARRVVYCEEEKDGLG
jgi:hypothetical protein